MSPHPFRRFSTRAFGACLVLTALAGCTTAANVAQQRMRFSEIRDRYFLTILQLNPVTSMYLGGDGWDPALRGVNGRLRDYRPESLAREIAFFREIRDARASIRPETLTPAERTDHAVLGAQLNFILHQLEEVRYYQRAVDTYVAEPARGIGWQIHQMQRTEEGLRGTEAEWRLLIDRLRAIPSYLEAARSNLLEGKESGNLPEGLTIERDGIAGSHRNADYFRSNLPDLARRLIGERPFAAAVVAELEASALAAATAYVEFGTFLEDTYGVNRSPDRFVMPTPEPLRVPRGPHELYAD
ncbi:MAG: DUF885 family protein [Gemmatimonadetes bacterium]|nr:DUF885 family protein [Gemmatimonadota bacterium]